METTPVAARRSGGFTLLEMLVVVFIIGLASALVVPRMMGSLPGVQLKSTARAVAASLRFARSKSVAETIPYVAIFDRRRRVLTVGQADTLTGGPGSPVSSADGNVSKPVRAYEFPADIVFSLSNEEAAGGDDRFRIFFYPRGDSTGGKIIVGNLRRRQYAITVDRITGTVAVDRL